MVGNGFSSIKEGIKHHSEDFDESVRNGFSIAGLPVY